MHRTAAKIWSTATIEKRVIMCLLNFLHLQKKKKGLVR